MRIAITADLHYGHNRAGDDATQLMLAHLQANPPDLLLLGGDNGTESHFDECLRLFQPLPCAKALVPGNHDLWVATNDSRGDSMRVYDHHLPDLCKQYDYHYLDQASLVLPEANLAIVGNINWYDYSWSLERLQAEVPNWEWHLSHKAFTRGRHNDGRFVVWPTDDVGFTRRVVAELERQLIEALASVERVIVMTHHPAFHGIGFPRPTPAQGLDELLWEALSGNRALEELLLRHAERIPLIFSGHIHRAAEAMLGPARGINVGGDYHFKQMLTVDWPACTVETHVFGDPNRRRSRDRQKISTDRNPIQSLFFCLSLLSYLLDTRPCSPYLPSVKSPRNDLSWLGRFHDDLAAVDPHRGGTRRRRRWSRCSSGIDVDRSWLAVAAQHGDRLRG